MRLFVGKNHQGQNVPVQSLFRLVGSDEDALTYALGFLLALDYEFCAKIIRRLGIVPRLSLNPDYSVYLQEVTDSKFGRRDIVIEDGGMRLVLEAKIGKAEPTSEQLLKYASEKKLWKQYEVRGIVSLTQAELSAATKEKILKQLSEMHICGKKIQFANIQWHEVVELAFAHRASVDSETSRYLFDEFIRYIRKDYDMGYYDAEIHIQDVNSLNASIFKECWMYVTSIKDKKAPLYFAPYFTKQGKERGVSMMSRVRDIEIAVLESKQELTVVPPSEQHRIRWSEGLCRLREKAKNEGFAHYEVQLFYLDQPIDLTSEPFTKQDSKGAGLSKQIPSQIPKGFSLGFDDILKFSRKPLEIDSATRE